MPLLASICTVKAEGVFSTLPAHRQPHSEPQAKGRPGPHAKGAERARRVRGQGRTAKKHRMVNMLLLHTGHTARSATRSAARTASHQPNLRAAVGSGAAQGEQPASANPTAPSSAASLAPECAESCMLLAKHVHPKRVPSPSRRPTFHFLCRAPLSPPKVAVHRHLIAQNAGRASRLPRGGPGLAPRDSVCIDGVLPAA